jgi:hypothetical protein
MITWTRESDAKKTKLNTDKRSEDDDEEAVDKKYLKQYLAYIMNMGTNDKRCGHVVKCLLGLDSKPIGHAHADVQTHCLTLVNTRLSSQMELMKSIRQM